MSNAFDGRGFGRQRMIGSGFPRHRHDHGYICVVLRGRFVEAGDDGRFRVAAGHALVHRPFQSHLDRLESSGAELLNLPLPGAATFAGLLRLDDPDQVARLAERDPSSAAAEVLRQGKAEKGEADWPDLLAERLRAGADVPLGQWARAHGLAAATISRGFRRAYGATAARFRAEARARRAWEAIVATRQPLAAIAYEHGFADQPHLTRAVRDLSGKPPARWRERPDG